VVVSLGGGDVDLRVGGMFKGLISLGANWRPSIIGGESLI